jgi:hypothetical protein
MKDNEVLKKVDQLFASVEKEIVESEDCEEFWWYEKNLSLSQADVENMPTDTPKAQFLHILFHIMQHGMDDEDMEDLMSLSDTLPLAG